jgi:hypothetical protein
MKFLLLFLLCGFLFIHLSYAQDKLTGRVFENKTMVSLSGIEIKNLISGNTAVSDSAGNFSIKAAVGDYISFSGFSYRPDTLFVTSLKHTEIYLTLTQNVLNEVKITTPEINTGSLAAPVARIFGANALQYQTDENGNYRGGIKIMLFDYNDKKKTKDAKIKAEDEKQQQIYEVFKAQNLKNYLPITGQEMENFIILYTPDVKTYYSPDFILTVYLNTCYQKFLEIPVEDRQSKTYLQLVGKSN